MVLVSSGVCWTPVCAPTPEASLRHHVSCGSRPWQVAPNAWLDKGLARLRRRLGRAGALAAHDAVVVAGLHAGPRKALEYQRLRLLERAALYDALRLERQQVIAQVVFEG